MPPRNIYPDANTDINFIIKKQKKRHSFIALTFISFWFTALRKLFPGSRFARTKGERHGNIIK